MATVIRLDTNALKHLFDKLGDDFVLELRATALKEAIKQRIGVTVSDEFEKMVHEIILETTRAEVTTYRGRGSVTLQDAVRERIRNQVHTEVRRLVLEEISMVDVQAMVDRAAEHQAQRIRERVYQVLHEQVTEWAKEEVNRRLALLAENTK